MAWNAKCRRPQIAGLKYPRKNKGAQIGMAQIGVHFQNLKAPTSGVAQLERAQIAGARMAVCVGMWRPVSLVSISFFVFIQNAPNEEPNEI